MTRKLVIIIIYAWFCVSLNYALAHGATSTYQPKPSVDIPLQTAGQTYADPNPYYKGASNDR